MVAYQQVVGGALSPCVPGIGNAFEIFNGPGLPIQSFKVKVQPAGFIYHRIPIGKKRKLKPLCSIFPGVVPGDARLGTINFEAIRAVNPALLVFCKASCANSGDDVEGIRLLHPFSKPRLHGYKKQAGSVNKDILHIPEVTASGILVVDVLIDPKLLPGADIYLDKVYFSGKIKLVVDEPDQVKAEWAQVFFSPVSKHFINISEGHFLVGYPQKIMDRPIRQIYVEHGQISRREFLPIPPQAVLRIDIQGFIGH